MITKDKAQRIIDTAVEHAGKRVQGTEVLVEGSTIATTRFAENSITQNQAPEQVQVSVRVIAKGRQARLSTNQTDSIAVRQLVDNAIQVAKLLEKDEELPAMAKAKLAPEENAVKRHNRSTAYMSADERAAKVSDMVDVAKEFKLDSAGVYATGEVFQAIGNSQGLFACHRESYAECSVTMLGKDSSGWSKAQSDNAKVVDSTSLARRAAEIAKMGMHPQEMPAGLYTVILPPAAVLDLLTFLWYDFSATSHIDKLSSLLNKVGIKAFGSNITIADDVFHSLSTGAPFDGEGVARKPITLVENGVIKSLVYGRRAAEKLGCQPTGHGFSQPSPEGEMAQNLVISGGETSMDEMIASAKKAILLTRVWYVRLVDPMTILVTGMTRDGVFAVENGKITKPVKNLRFNVSIHDLLNNVIALGPAERAAGEESQPLVVPAMLVENFNFTSTTAF